MKIIISFLFIFINFYLFSAHLNSTETLSTGQPVKLINMNPGDFKKQGYKLTYFLSNLNETSYFYSTYVFEKDQVMATCYEVVDAYGIGLPRIKCYMHINFLD